MAYPLYSLTDKGFVQRKRESVFAVIADPNMSSTHSHIFERLLVFVSPFSCKLEISDGVSVKKIELPQGSMVTSADKLIELTRCCKRNLFEKLKDLQSWDYIFYGSFNSKTGEIKISRKSNQFEQIYIQIKDYEYYIEIGKANFALPAEIGKAKFALPPNSGEANLALPANLVGQNIPIGNAKNALPNLSNPTNNNKLSAPIIQQQQLFNNKQQQDNVVVYLQKLFKEKSEIKLTESICLNLLGKFPLEKVTTNISRLKLKNADNPVGLLIRSLESNYDLSPTQEELLETEKKKADDLQRRKKEEFKEYEKNQDDESQRFISLDKKYNALPVEEQEKLRDMAVKEIKTENKSLGNTGLSFILKNERTLKIKMLTIMERLNIGTIQEKRFEEKAEEKKGSKLWWCRFFG